MSPTMFDAWLVGLREENDGLPSIEEQQAFLDFLNHKATAEEAASVYTHIVNNTKHRDPESLWLLLWQAAEEWPETHERLVELLKAISRLPPVLRGSIEGEGSKEEYWSTLPEFEFGLREYWDGNEILDTKSLNDESEIFLGKATRVIYNADPKTQIAFVNLTSFNARLFRDEVFDLHTWALMTLSIALEKDYEGQSHVLDTFVPAAAQYILQTGSTVYKCNKEAIFAGPLLEKARGKGPVERWGFWKENFELAQDREDLKENTRATAKQVVRRMEKIEKESH